MKNRAFLATLALFLAFALCACQGVPAATPTPEASPITLTDRSGFAITPPTAPSRIVALSPALCEVLVGLGMGDKIIAIATYSEDVEGLSADLPAIDMYSPDAEQILALEPDLVLVSGLSQVGTDDPLKSLKDMGVCVAYVPSSDSLEGIYADIRFVAQAVGKTDEGEAIVESMKAEIETVRQVAATIPQEARKTVLFEISAAPEIYSFGSGTYLNELLEAVGLTNVLAEHSGWLAVSGEWAVQLNPDVILTSVSYIDDPVGEILSRGGFADVTAVKEKAVFKVNENLTNRPSQHVVTAMREIARAVYPEYFAD